MNKKEILDSIYFFLALLVMIIAYFNTQLAWFLGFILMSIYVPFAVLSYMFEWQKSN